MIKVSSLVPSDIENPELRIPVLNYEKTKSPVIWLSACSHGDEVGGVAIIHELFKVLEEKMIKGSVYAFPMANPIAFDKGTRLVGGEDLNRSFPGRPSGTVADKTAHQIFTRIKKTNPDLVIDLHNDWTHSIPYAILDPIPGQLSEKAFKIAKFISSHVGFVVVEETIDKMDDSTIPEWKKTLSGSLVSSGIPAMVLEIGESKVINENNVKMGVQAILNVLSRLGMTNQPENFVHPSLNSIGKRVLYYNGRPRSSTNGGIIRFRAKPGSVVKKGQVLAQIYDVLGKEIESLISEGEGVILGHAETSVAKPNIPLIAMAMVSKV